MDLVEEGGDEVVLNGVEGGVGDLRGEEDEAEVVADGLFGGGGVDLVLEDQIHALIPIDPSQFEIALTMYFKTCVNFLMLEM